MRALWQWILKLLDSSYDSFLIWWQEGRNECTTCSWLAIYLRDEADAVEADAVEADAAEADAAQEADAMAEEVWNSMAYFSMGHIDVFGFPIVLAIVEATYQPSCAWDSQLMTDMTATSEGRGAC